MIWKVSKTCPDISLKYKDNGAFMSPFALNSAQVKIQNSMCKKKYKQGTLSYSALFPWLSFDYDLDDFPHSLNY